MFRDTIDEIDKKSLSPQFQSFPDGSCGAASDVLGTYLDELGYEPIYRVLKYCRITEQNQSHTWLEYENLLIDITADQFNDNLKIAPLFGTKKSVNVTEDSSLWYKVFDSDMGDEDRRVAHFRFFEECGDSRAVEMIERDYITILSHIPKKFWPNSRK